MEKITFSPSVNAAFNFATNYIAIHRHEFIMPEHLLLAFIEQKPFSYALDYFFVDRERMKTDLEDYMTFYVEQIPVGMEYEPELSDASKYMLGIAELQKTNSGVIQLTVPHIMNGMLQLEKIKAISLLEEILGDNINDFLNEIVDAYDMQNSDFDETEAEEEKWKNPLVCLNDSLAKHNPLIGREIELERTIQVLCRLDKNNPLHVGEPGVGKTSLAYGLAARIENGQVPERLKGYRIYALELGSLLSGTQFRGEFEKKLKSIMDGLKAEGKAILYIDEIHNLVGAGQTGEGSMDASNMLKPYMESGEIRFIGSTTYEEYNRYFSRSKGLVRRFQQIDVPEPGEDETIRILEGLIARYEDFHGVSYTTEAVYFAVNAAARYISGRFLPDKAIDLIDEAGAYRELHPLVGIANVVDKNLIADVLSKMCNVESLSAQSDEEASLETLGKRILSKIYGQDEAVRSVVESVQIARAGLLDENKPLSSLLFVGPTGVGKTEVARVLAAELGVTLVRLDMSEFAEKHTVAKLIGSPAGYVGYEDGGLLTDAVRKSPSCVLLLDEIEKAHADVFNVLLQVMDYAVLTDNKGRKTDFRHVVIIMTSNAGAEFSRKASLGFDARVSSGDAMLSQVKRTFKPEFLNRLSGTIVFRDMDKGMASLILDKKLSSLSLKLSQKNVDMLLSTEAREWLLAKGFSIDYGAREMDRTISYFLKPLFMREILFGALREGGKARVDVRGDKLCLSMV